MDRYSIMLKKTPPPPPPEEEKPVKEKKKKKSGSLTTQERQNLIGQYLQTAEGRARLAASMVNPLRQRLDYNSVARRAFRVDPLPAGALPMYDKDPNVPAFMISQDGNRPITVDQNYAEISGISNRRVPVPIFEIATNPQVPLTSIRQRRFELIDRAQDLAIQDLRNEEDSKAMDLLNLCTSRQDPIQLSNVESEIRNVFSDTFHAIESHELRVSNIYMNAADYARLRRPLMNMTDQADTFRPGILRDGLLPSIWGAEVVVSRVVTPGQIYVAANNQMLGVLPVRVDLTVLPADDPVNRLIGWSIFEEIGMCLLNPSAVIRLTAPVEEPTMARTYNQILSGEREIADDLRAMHGI
jgi:hypothetical protein